MDDNLTKVTAEQSDGFSQLAEKMEQVRTQMVKMERKYDELYKAVKERDSKLTNQSEENKHERPSTADSSTTSSTRSSLTEDPEKSEKRLDQSKDDKGKSTPEPDIEKMEDNPFL